MRPSSRAIFIELASEAVWDATRRRIVPMIACVSLISLLAVDSCTSCGSGNITANGEVVPVSEIAGWTGMLVISALSLWMMVLAGLLASDHLSEPLSDGSAGLVLSRPVKRSAFAGARLAGALAIAMTTAFVVLSGSAALLHLRNGLPLAPAAWAGLACVAGSVVVGAFAMTLSLRLTRVVTAMSVLVFVGSISFINSFALFGVPMGTVGTVVQAFTPPLCTALVVALAPWTDPVVPEVDPVIMILKLVSWVIVSVGILLGTFNRYEIRQ
ncbi:MAG: hypothetical protein AAEJ52_21635 [Myxococcota bacterium]